MGGDLKYKTVALPFELYATIERVVKDSADFASVEDFVTFVLNEVLPSPSDGKMLTEREEKEIKRTLKALGHFDP